MAERDLPEAADSAAADPFVGLRDLAQRAESHASPVAAERVRQLGDRRRSRRHIALATFAALAVCATGGVLVSQNGFLTHRVPDPASTPSISAAQPTPTPGRSVTSTNLLQTEDIPAEADQTVDITPSGVGRSVEQSSVCLPAEGLNALGATAILSRNFRYTTSESTDPSIYSQVLQFGSAAEAQQAVATYRSWLSDCGSTLVRNGWTRLGERPSGSGQNPQPWIEYVDSGGVVSGYAEAPTYRGATEPPGEGWFESVGLTRVDDRLMITVYLVRGQDFNVVNDPDGDPDIGLPAHPHFALLRAAAERLAE